MEPFGSIVIMTLTRNDGLFPVGWLANGETFASHSRASRSTFWPPQVPPRFDRIETIIHEDEPMVNLFRQ